MPLVYDELRRIAGSYLGPGEARAVDATEVVHEAYLRLMGISASVFWHWKWRKPWARRRAWRHTNEQ